MICSRIRRRRESRTCRPCSGSVSRYYAPARRFHAMLFMPCFMSGENPRLAASGNWSLPVFSSWIQQQSVFSSRDMVSSVMLVSCRDLLVKASVSLTSLIMERISRFLMVSPYHCRLFLPVLYNITALNVKSVDTLNARIFRLS